MVILLLLLISINEGKMNNLALKDKLQRYLDSGFPIIYINSFEEQKAEKIIKEVIKNRKGFEWNAARGLLNFNTKEHQEYNDLEEYLNSIVNSGLEAELDRKVLVLKDVHFYLNEAKIISLLKYIAIKITQGLDTSIIIISPVVVIPKELEKFITILEPEYPTEKEIANKIQEFVSQNQLPELDSALLEEMSITLKGLTEYEVYSILCSAIADDGELTREDLKLVFSQKQQMIQKSGILEMIPLKENIDEIGGLENLKIWLQRKSKVYREINKAKAFGVDMPKGVLIAGVPGCGKSLSAKVTASLFEVPLLRLDIGKILGKYVGESEENMRKAISLAEAISPCVLWVDELEKAFAGIGSGGEGNEVTVRLFGAFLTWMQEKTSSVFVIATANDITKLPPELMRKGRFDEIFFVGLPNEEERKKIFEIHIKKRRAKDFSEIDISKLISKTKGYSGADIEGVVKEAIENAFTDGKDKISTEYILNAISDTHSLSEIMKESLDSMSKIYEDRKFKNASK